MIPELAMNPLADRVVFVVLDGCSDHINFRQFLQVLYVFHEDSEDRRAMVLFKILDMDGDGALSAEDLTKATRVIVGTTAEEGGVSDEDVRVMVDATLEALGGSRSRAVLPDAFAAHALRAGLGDLSRFQVRADEHDD